MNRPKASDYDPRVLALFDRYVHGGLSRREFLDRATSVTAGGAAAATLLADYATGQEVPEGDPRIRTARIEYQSPQGYGTVKGLLARPASSSGKIPGVLVVHENRGLNPYIEDVARRLGAEGYLALAPDGLTSLGGYPGNDDDGRAMQAKLDRNKMLEDFIAGVKHLQNHADCTGKVGAVGFCFGGGICNALAVRVPDLAASVPFYGSQPPASEVSSIHAPLMLQYAGNDERVNAGWQAYEAALKANDKSYQAYFYPGTNHGFHNYSTPRYDEGAAKLAWERTLAFFKKNLS